MATFKAAISVPALLLTTVLLTACGGDRFADWGGSTKDKDKDLQRLIISMPGRWMLSSANRGQCGMDFTGAPKATEGAVRPGGGCPGNFFTSRTWVLQENRVIIRDHNGEELVKLEPAGSGSSMWFEGQANTGERVMLARQ
jgi:hypothetical protein